MLQNQKLLKFHSFQVQDVNLYSLNKLQPKIFYNIASAILEFQN